MRTSAGSLFITLLLLFSIFSCSRGEKATVTVSAVTNIARTDDNFICATLDWWPPEKCNYGMCPWGQASMLNLDLDNPILFNALRVFGSLRVRLGGSLQDQIVYNVGKHGTDCPNLTRDDSGLFGFTKGCLTMERWNQLNQFFKKTKSILTFGLNALTGRTKATQDVLYQGNWDPRNARDFIKYTISHNYDIESWEFGNELCGTGVAARVQAKQYATDLIAFKNMISKLYQRTGKQPKILTPGGFYEEKWFSDMLQSSGPDVVDAVTHHIYNLGAGVDKNLIYKMQDPFYLDKIAQTYNDLQNTIKNFGPWSSAWVSESGGAYNSGGKDVSNAFVDSFWYLDQLGMVSTYNHKVFCRQALIGGNYALLDTQNFVPNPDYYGALLWHQLMGPGVLQTTRDGSPYLRAYAHCSKQKPGVTLLLINLSNSTAFDVSVGNDTNLHPSQIDDSQGSTREEYHLSPQGGDLKSRVLLLNGEPLTLAYGMEIPVMKPLVNSASAPLQIAPQTIAFVRLVDFEAPACSS